MRRLAALTGGLCLAALLAPALPLPLPPPPAPPDPQAGVRAAPVPDPDMDGMPAPPPETVVRPRMFRQGHAGFDQGYLPGSQYQSEEERRVIATPGVTVKVPLP